MPRLRNLSIHGAFSNFDDIPHEKFDAVPYTSQWDGLPNILLEAGERQLPIIAPTIGGIGELMTPAINHVVAKDTIYFCRRKQSGGALWSTP